MAHKVVRAWVGPRVATRRPRPHAMAVTVKNSVPSTPGRADGADVTVPCHGGHVVEHSHPFATTSALDALNNQHDSIPWPHASQRRIIVIAGALIFY